MSVQYHINAEPSAESQHSDAELSAAAQDQPSQSTAAEAEQEGDDMPPIQNTLDSQPAPEEAAVGSDPGANLAAAPAAHASSTPQLPQQSLVDKLNDAAEEELVLTKTVGTEDGSIAFVTEPGIAEGIQTSADAAAATAGIENILSSAGKVGTAPSAGKSDTAPPAGKAGVQSAPGKAAEQGRSATAIEADKAIDDSAAEQPADQAPAKTRSSRAAKAAATAKIANTAVLESGGKKSRSSADRKKISVAKVAVASSDKESAVAGTPVPAEEANHMAEKEPHSRVEEVRGSKGVSPSQDSTSNKKKNQEGSVKRDPMIGRCIKKDFETDSGTKTYTGWIIGKHEKKAW